MYHDKNKLFSDDIWLMMMSALYLTSGHNNIFQVDAIGFEFVYKKPRSVISMKARHTRAVIVMITW
jgi:hypothetical protein